MDPVEFLGVLRRHILLFVTCILLCLSAAGLWTLSQTPEYQADATAIVSVDSGGGSGTSGLEADERARSRAVTYVALGDSRALATTVIRDLDLDMDPGFLLAQTSFEQPPDTSLVRVVVRSNSADEARLLADAWLSVLSDRVSEIENPSGEVRADAPRLAIVEPASKPESPVYPRPPLNVAIGLAVGLLIGAAGAMLRDRATLRIRSASDVRDRIGLGVVAEVPKSTLRRASRRPTSRTGRRRPSTAEPVVDPIFEDLRTQLQYLDVDQPPRSLLVTSPTDSFASSTTARQLARAIADAGQRVVLVELDFESPTMAADLGLDPSAGLLQVLTDRIPVRAARQRRRDHGQVDYVVAGGTASNPGELIGSRSLRRALESLNEDSFLLVYARPVFAGPATELISTFVDGVVLVAPVRRTSFGELRRAIEQVSRNAGDHVAIVLTGGRSGPTRQATVQTPSSLNEPDSATDESGSPGQVADATVVGDERVEVDSGAKRQAV